MDDGHRTKPGFAIAGWVAVVAWILMGACYDPVADGEYFPCYDEWDCAEGFYCAGNAGCVDAPTPSELADQFCDKWSTCFSGVNYDECYDDSYIVAREDQQQGRVCYDALVEYVDCLGQSSCAELEAETTCLTAEDDYFRMCGH